MYGGPWSSNYRDDRMIALLLVFMGVALAAIGTGWLLWTHHHSGPVLNLMLLPVEAVFWIGFALPVPWLLGVARVVLVCLAWRSLSTESQGHTAGVR